MSIDQPRRTRKRRADGLATRERIEDVATTMFAASGYEATSLRQLAAAAGVDIATLKYHYDDKPALFARIYSVGHARFVEALAPIVLGLESARSSEDLFEVLSQLVVSMHDFIEDNLSFVRLTLFRVLEERVDVIAVEQELQSVAIGMLEGTFQRLVERGVVRQLDARAFVVFLISSFTTWHVMGRVKDSWLGEPGLDTGEGRARSEAFFLSSVSRILGIDPPGERL